MVQIDIPIAFALGALSADAARDELRTGRSEPFWRTFTKSLLYFVFAVSWLPIYLLVQHFGFETSHMWWHQDHLADYPWFVPIFTVVFFGAHVVGYVTGVGLVRRGKITQNRLLIVAVALFTVGWIFLQPHRTLVVGSYSEWAAGSAPGISSDPGLVRLLVGYAIAFHVSIVAFYLRLRRN